MSGDEAASPALARAQGLPEGWPSGQWQQTVNLPTNVYVGSNPTPSTIDGGAGEEGFARVKRVAGAAPGRIGPEGQVDARV